MGVIKKFFFITISISSLVSMNNDSLLSMNRRDLEYPQTPPTTRRYEDPDYIYQITQTAQKRQNVSPNTISSKTILAWPRLWNESHAMDRDFIWNLAHISRLQDKKTLLHIAMSKEIYRDGELLDRKINCIKDLILYGEADLYAKDSCGQTPLHLWSCCSSSFDREVFEILTALWERIEYSGDLLNWKKLKDEKTGSTPLHIVCSCGLVNFPKFKIFLELGAPLGCINNYGQTILHRLASTGYSNEHKEAILNYLEEIFYSIPVFEQVELIEFVNKRDNNGKTAIHLAILNGDVVMFDFLLNLEWIDLNFQDLYGNTPLHFAAYNVRKKNMHGKYMVEKLLNERAHKFILNDIGNLPVNLVDPICVDVIKMLTS